MNLFNLFDAVLRMRSVKKGVHKYFCAGVSYCKETPAQVLPCEFPESVKRAYFKKHLQSHAFGLAKERLKFSEKVIFVLLQFNSLSFS